MAETGEGVIETVETTGFTDDPATANALVIKDQRLYVAYNNSIYCSQIDDFLDFSFSAPRVASEGEIIIFPEGGNKINALGLRPEYVAVFKDDFIGSVEFKDFGDGLSDIPVLDTLFRDTDVGAVGPKAVAQKIKR